MMIASHAFLLLVGVVFQAIEVRASDTSPGPIQRVRENILKETIHDSSHLSNLGNYLTPSARRASGSYLLKLIDRKIESDTNVSAELEEQVHRLLQRYHVTGTSCEEGPTAKIPDDRTNEFFRSVVKLAERYLGRSGKKKRLRNVADSYVQLESHKLEEGYWIIDPIGDSVPFTPLFSLQKKKDYWQLGGIKGLISLLAKHSSSGSDTVPFPTDGENYQEHFSPDNEISPVGATVTSLGFEGDGLNLRLRIEVPRHPNLLQKNLGAFPGGSFQLTGINTSERTYMGSRLDVFRERKINFRDKNPHCEFISYEKVIQFENHLDPAKFRTLQANLSLNIPTGYRTEDLVPLDFVSSLESTRLQVILYRLDPERYVLEFGTDHPGRFWTIHGLDHEQRSIENNRYYHRFNRVRNRKIRFATAPESLRFYYATEFYKPQYELNEPLNIERHEVTLTNPDRIEDTSPLYVRVLDQNSERTHLYLRTNSSRKVLGMYAKNPSGERRYPEMSGSGILSAIKHRRVTFPGDIERVVIFTTHE